MQQGDAKGTASLALKILGSRFLELHPSFLEKVALVVFGYLLVSEKVRTLSRFFDEASVDIRSPSSFRSLFALFLRSVLTAFSCWTFGLLLQHTLWNHHLFMMHIKYVYLKLFISSHDPKLFHATSPLPFELLWDCEVFCYQYHYHCLLASAL